MMNVHALPCAPDAAAMYEMAEALFGRAHDGLIELSWTSAQHPHRLTGAQMYDLDQVDDLVRDAQRLNATPNRNVYISAGLRRGDVTRDRRAGKDGVLAVSAVWVDCDEPGVFETAQQISSALGIEPSFVMFTGKHPHARGSLWWVLDAQSEELARAEAIEKALARKFGADPAAAEYSRVMRLAGSVAWPLKQGRILEMTGIENGADTRHKPYTLDELEAALTAAGVMERPRATAEILNLNGAAISLDLESLAREARQPGKWHQSALRAVAHVIGRGMAPDLAEETLALAFTTTGYTVDDTRADLRVMIAGAVKKGWLPNQPLHHSRDAPTDLFPLVELDEFSVQEGEWLIEGILPQTGLAAIYGPSESFKSFIALDMALSIAYGLPWRDRPTKEGSALYIAGEGQRGVMQRSIVWRNARGHQGPRHKFWLAPRAISFLDPKHLQVVTSRAAEAAPALIVIDTVARTFAGGDENSTKDMNAYIAAADALREATNALILFVHHTGKDEERGARGSSAFRAALDTELATSRASDTDTRVTLKVTKQKDADKVAPVGLRLASAAGVDPKTGEEITSLLPVLDEDGPVQPVKDTGVIGPVERAVLDALDDGPASTSTLAKRLGKDKANVRRALKNLGLKSFVRPTSDGLYERNDAFDGGRMGVTEQMEENQ